MMSDRNKNVISLFDYLDERRVNNSPTVIQPESEMTPTYLKKIASFTLDFMTILTLKLMATISYASFVQNYFFMLNRQQMAHLVSANFSFHLSLIVLIYYSYFLFCNYALEGKTLGKMVFKISTVNDNFIFDQKETDISMSLSQANRRAFGYLLCYLSFGTFFIFSFFSEDKRGLQDFFSGTRTVNDEWIDSIMDYKEHGTEVITIDIMQLDRAA